MADSCPSPFITISPPAHTTLLDLAKQNRHCYSTTCCLPCIADNLIAPGAWSAANRLNTISCISCALMVVLVILLLAFPNQMGRTKYNLGLAVSLAFFHSPELVNLFSSMQDTLCVDATAKATAATNYRCAIQGSLIIYGSLSTLLWSAMRIMTLHCALAYRVVLAGPTETAAMIFICSVIPMFHVILAFVLNAVNYQVGHLCTPTVDVHGFFALWGPDILVVCPIMVVYIATFVIIAKIVRKQRLTGNYRASGPLQGPEALCSDDRARLKRLAGNRPSIGSVWAFVRLEWRPFVSFATTALISFMFVHYSCSFLYHKQEYLHKMVGWFRCLAQTQGNLKQCRPAIEYLVPKLRFLVVAETCRAFAGMVVFLMEISKGAQYTINYLRMGRFRD